MGNRATIIFTNNDDTSISPAVYLHWNGGPESVYPFLVELNRRQVRADQDYECARFIQLVGEFFDQDSIGSHSLGVTNGPKAINVVDLGKVRTGDNGFYIVDRTAKDGKVRMRRFLERYEKEKCTLVEMSPVWVEAERVEAEKSEYRIGIAESFKRITGDKEIR